MTAQQHRQDVDAANSGADRLTVGTVQSSVKKGMSGAEILQILGSPNIVSTDSSGNEVWVYDRISSEKTQSNSKIGASILIVGGRQSASASSTSQRTLTVILKFDAEKKVRDIAYHTSRF